jgi:hypothetical protein
MSRVRVAILLMAGMLLGMCACGLALLALFQVQVLELASAGRPAPSAWAPPSVPPPLPPPTASPTPTPTATLGPWIPPTPLAPPPTVLILPLGTPEIAKCDQPSVITALAQAVEPVTSSRVQGELINNGVEGGYIIEEMIDDEGLRSHSLLSVHNAQGMTQTQEMIIIRDWIWEKQPDGAWGPPQTVTATGRTVGPMWAKSWFSYLKIKGKIGTTLTADRPVDVYWASTNDGEGPLHVDPRTCLPVQFTMSDDLHGKRTSMTFEWNIPITITPPAP